MKLNFLTMLLAFAALTMYQTACPQTDRETLERVNRILQEAPIFDGHNDLPWVIRKKFGGDVESYDISVRAQFDTDIPRLREGMILALEPMLNIGTPDVCILEDNWTVVTADGQLSAHFEHTVAIADQGGIVLSQM